MASVSLKYGLAGGGFSILVFVILWLVGINPLVTNRIYDFLLIPLFVFFSVKEFRDFRNNKALHFWQGMGVGMFTFLVMGLVSGLFIWLLLEFGNTGLMQDYVATRISMINESKQALVDQLGEKTVAQSLTDLPKTSSFQLGMDDFMKKVFIGSFFTAIIALILRKHSY